jgi:hypothetical protein
MRYSKFDPAKRHTIKLLGGAALVAAAPSVTAGERIGVNAVDLRAIKLSGSSAELSFILEVAEQSVLTMINNTDRLLIVRHVHPGIVHAGALTFDINSAFARSGYAISAGKSRKVEIAPVDKFAVEADFPRARERHNPQRIVSLTGSDKNGLLVNSTRSFYA